MAVYTLRIDPTPRFPLSPYLYMQFMEPLGATDIEAAWDLAHGDWRRHADRHAGPHYARWGGCLPVLPLARGRRPISQRAPYHNLLWRIESHPWAPTSSHALPRGW